jgi:3-hydroxymyristoyl/3-hydroxydecanoyl-(acyl carrier protein) dehydratase
MIAEPLILEQRVAPPTAELKLEVPADLVYLKGPLPGAPIVAGVVQVKWAIELARRHLDAGGEREFVGMDALKFQQLMRPGAVVTLELEWEAVAGKLRFSYRSDDARYSSGRILLRRRA